MLLLEYVIHILESCIEEEEEEEDLGSLQDLLSDDQFLTQPDQPLFHPLDSLPTSECASRSVESPQVTLKHMSQNCSPMGTVGSMVLQVLGFLVDTATGNKVDAPTHVRAHTYTHIETHTHTGRERQTDTQAERDRHRHRQGENERQADRHTHMRETGRETHRDRQTDTYTKRGRQVDAWRDTDI